MGIVRCIVEVDESRCAVKAHTLDESIEQFAAYYLCEVLYAEHIVQSMCDRVHGVIAEAVVRPVLRDLWAVPRAFERCGRIVIMI